MTIITKGIIKSKLIDSNKYLVEIPYLEQASVKNNGSTESFLEATLSHTPGIINSYNENDVVFVSFEDDMKDKPIIIGKLFLDDNDNRGYANFGSLNVSDGVKLPENTVIGNFNFKDFVGTLADIETNSLQIKAILEGGGGGGDAPADYVRSMSIVSEDTLKFVTVVNGLPQSEQTFKSNATKIIDLRQ